MFGVMMPICNRMSCCIFGCYFYIEIRLKCEKIILLSSSRAFSLSTPMENSEATWKKATKCSKYFLLTSANAYIPSGGLWQDNVLQRPGHFPYFLSHVSTIVQLKMVNCQSKRIKKSFDKVLAQSGEESDLRFISIPILLKEDLIIMTQTI